MKQYDPQKAAQVWQRVQNQDAAAPDSLPALIMAQWETAAACRRISETGLQEIRRMAQRHIHCLKGIYRLVNDQPPVVRAPAPAGDAAPLALRKCYLRMLRCLREYESRSEDPEYGPVFRQLALEQREGCCRLLAYLGAQDQSTK